MFNDAWNQIATCAALVILWVASSYAWFSAEDTWSRSRTSPKAFEHSASGRAYLGKPYERVR